MDRTLAAAAVVVLHMAALMLALPTAPPVSAGSTIDHGALEITWVKRRPARMPNAVVAPRMRSIALDQRAASSPMRPAAPRSNADTKPVLDASDAVALSGTSASPMDRPLDLRLPETTPSFERNPLARREPQIEAYQDRMTLQFSDSSVGGTWRRMTQARICSELRRALRTAGGGAYGVIESMRENGCPV